MCVDLANFHTCASLMTLNHSTCGEEMVLFNGESVRQIDDDVYQRKMICDAIFSLFLALCQRSKEKN